MDKKHVPESYIRLSFLRDKCPTVFLDVDVIYDPIEKQYLAILKTQETGALIYAHGTNSQELEDNIILAIHKKIQEGYGEELFKMMKEDPETAHE